MLLKLQPIPAIVASLILTWKGLPVRTDFLYSLSCSCGASVAEPVQSHWLDSCDQRLAISDAALAVD